MRLPWGYHALLHFFRSSAWSLEALLQHWFLWVLSQHEALSAQGRLVLFGDQTYVPKDGGRMPGVVTLHQHSDTQSKPSYFRGQCWGALGLAVGTMTAPFCLPLALRLHQGVVHRGEEQTETSSTMSERPVEMALALALQADHPALLILDAFFSVKSVFHKAASVYSLRLKAPLLEIIVRAKKNYGAYFPAPAPRTPQRGRPTKYGDAVHLMEVFDHSPLFHRVTARIYGQPEEIPLLCLDLLWKPTQGLIRFVFAQTSRGRLVLMCSNRQQDPLQAVALYCLRSRIEILFAMLKQLLGLFHFHFWTKRLPRHSRKPQRNQALQPPSSTQRATVIRCWQACERFVNRGAIALGLLQLIALKYSPAVWSRFEGFLRTRSRTLPSERTVKTVLTSLIGEDFFNPAPRATMRKIQDTFGPEKRAQKLRPPDDPTLQQAA